VNVYTTISSVAQEKAWTLDPTKLQSPTFDMSPRVAQRKDRLECIGGVRLGVPYLSMVILCNEED